MTKTMLAAGVAAAALTLSACGSSGTDTKTSTTSATAGSTSSATTPAGTSTSSSTSTSETAAAGGGDFAGAKVGDEVDAAELATAMTSALKTAKSGHIVMDMGAMLKGEGDFEVVGNKQNQSLDMEVAGQKTQTLIVDGDTYVKTALTGNGKWVKSSGSTAGMPDASSFDPATIAKALGGTKAKVTKKDGDTTTFSMEVDLKKVLGASGASMPAGVNLPPSMPLIYTIDSENRPTQMSMDMGPLKINLTYSDFGKKVDIKAPPSSDVTTM